MLLESEAESGALRDQFQAKPRLSDHFRADTVPGRLELDQQLLHFIQAARCVIQRDTSQAAGQNPQQQWTPITDNGANGTGPHADSRDMEWDAQIREEAEAMAMA